MGIKCTRSSGGNHKAERSGIALEMGSFLPQIQGCRGTHNKTCGIGIKWTKREGLHAALTLWMWDGHYLNFSQWHTDSDLHYLAPLTQVDCTANDESPGSYKSWITSMYCIIRTSRSQMNKSTCTGNMIFKNWYVFYVTKNNLVNISGQKKLWPR